MALVACADDASTGSGAGGAPEGGAGATGGTGADGGAGANTGATGAGASGAGAPECDPLPVTDELLVECPGVATLAAPFSSTTICGEDSSVFWPATVFEITVPAGACLEMQADNVGSPLGADLFASLVDPSGASLYFDEEMPCTVPNPEGFACPRGSSTTIEAGTAFIVVGAWEGDGCLPLEPTPFELAVAIDGVDVNLEAAVVCAGDLLEIIP